MNHESHHPEEGAIPDYGTSEHFERVVGTLWADNMREDEGILYFFFLRYFRRTERSRPQASSAAGLVSQAISPAEYAGIISRLLTDCRLGRDRDTGQTMPERLRHLSVERYDDLKRSIGYWASLAYDQQFVDELVAHQSTDGQG